MEMEPRQSNWRKRYTDLLTAYREKCSTQSWRFLHIRNPFRKKPFVEMVMPLPDLERIRTETELKISLTKPWLSDLVEAAQDAQGIASIKSSILEGWAFLLVNRNPDATHFKNPRIRIFPEELIERGGKLIPEQNLARTGLAAVQDAEKGIPYDIVAIAYCKNGHPPSGVDLDALTKAATKNPLMLLIDPNSRILRVICLNGLGNRYTTDKTYGDSTRSFPQAAQTMG